jgi:hypothetical protein
MLKQAREPLTQEEAIAKYGPSYISAPKDPSTMKQARTPVQPVQPVQPAVPAGGFAAKVMDDYMKMVEANQPVQSNPTDPTTTSDFWKQQAKDIEDWFQANQGNYDPSAFEYLRNQWQNQGIDPRQFSQNYEFYQDNGLMGWLGKGSEFTGQDYIFDPNTNQWVSRSRGSGFDLQGLNYNNPTQAQNRLDDIQRKISEIDADNKRLKEDPFWSWGQAANTVKSNEEKVKELRAEYDKIAKIMPQLQLDPMVSNLLDSYYDYLTKNELEGGPGVTSDPLTEEAYKQWEDLLMPLLEESLKNEYAPEVLKLLKEQLDPSFQKGRERIIADTARKGRIGGGLEASNLADLSNTLTQELMREGSKYADQTSEAVMNREMQDYQEKIRNYLDSLENVYGDQIGDINRVFQGSEADINRQIQEWAQGEGMNLEDELNNLGIGTEDYINALNDIGKLLETGGYLGTSLLNDKNPDSSGSNLSASSANANEKNVAAWWDAENWKKHYSS